LQRSTDENASLRSQLDIPKILILTKSFEIIEEPTVTVF